MPEAGAARAQDLATRLDQLHQRLDEACAAAGRERSAVELVAVTKFHPVADLETLRRLGLRRFGESRDQEARAKAAAVPGATWHFVGQLQTNKAASVASYASVVESVDRLPLVTALSTGAQKAERTLDVLVQVGLAADAAEGQRGGAALDAVAALAAAVADAPGLRLRGVMAVAPLGVDPDVAFARLAEVAGRVRRDHPGADVLSAGMSGDLEQAVAHGSTSVRVGTALLGPRPPALR